MSNNVNSNNGTTNGSFVDSMNYRNIIHDDIPSFLFTSESVGEGHPGK